MIPATDEARLIELMGHAETRDQGMQELFERLRGPVFGLALRITGRPERADDALQETFVDVMRAIDRFRGESRLTTWIFRVAVRASTRVASRAGRTVDALPEDLRSSAVDPAESASDRDAAAQILAAINRLSPPLRAVFALAGIDELPRAEVAEILGIPEGTVHSRLNAARERLKAELESTRNR